MYSMLKEIEDKRKQISMYADSYTIGYNAGIEEALGIVRSFTESRRCVICGQTQYTDERGFCSYCNTQGGIF